MTKTSMKILIVLFTTVLSANAQIEIAYGSIIKPMHFAKIPNDAELLLPQPGKLTIIYFTFAKEINSKVDDYLSALQNITKDLDIFLLASDHKMESLLQNAYQVIRPQHPDQLQPLWEMYLNAKENPLLLVDKECKVAFCGFLDSPENFNQILERLGVDFSIRQNSTLTDFIEYATLIQFKTGNNIDAQSLLKSKNFKLVLLYRSFCVPCSEDLLIKEILEYGKAVRPEALDYICIFRRLGEKESQQLDKIIKFCDPSFRHIYEAQKPNPVMERFFLKGNPLLLIFNTENKLVKTRAINRMSPDMLITFLNSIP